MWSRTLPTDFVRGCLFAPLALNAVKRNLILRFNTAGLVHRAPVGKNRTMTATNSILVIVVGVCTAGRTMVCPIDHKTRVSAWLRCTLQALPTHRPAIMLICMEK